MRIHKEFFAKNPMERYGELELCQFHGEISTDYINAIFVSLTLV